MTAQAPSTPVTAQRHSRWFPRIDWLLIMLIVLFLGYWFYMSALERIDSRPLLARFFFPELSPLQVSAMAIPPWITGFVELFYPRVLRHLIPVIVGWWLAKEAAVSLIQVLYNCPDRKTARDFLRRQRRTSAGSQDIPVKVTPESLDDLREESILLRVGGPVAIQIPDGFAGVTERNARFNRVLPPGKHRLGRFEYLVSIIDLMPQQRVAREIPLLSSDGIPLTTDASLVFSIDTDAEPSPEKPFPFKEEAVRQAAYSGAVTAGGAVSSWDDGPIGKVKGALGGQVARESLNKLIFDENPREVHRDLTQAVTREVWDKLPKDGIKPLQLRIGRLAPPEAVSRQYTEYWLANRQKTDMIARANGTAHLVQEVEVAKADAEVAMLQAIVEGVRRAQNEAGSQLTGYLLALRLLESLRRMVNVSSLGLDRPGDEATGTLLEHTEQLEDRIARLEAAIKTLPGESPAENSPKPE